MSLVTNLNINIWRGLFPRSKAPLDFNLTTQGRSFPIFPAISKSFHCNLCIQYAIKVCHPNGRHPKFSGWKRVEWIHCPFYGYSHKCKEDILSSKSMPQINPLHHNVSMQILQTVLYTFLKVLTRRICSAIKNFFSCWSFPLFSWHYCVIQGRYWREKLDAGQRFKVW